MKIVYLLAVITCSITFPASATESSLGSENNNKLAKSQMLLADNNQEVIIIPEGRRVYGVPRGRGYEDVDARRRVRR